MIFNRPSQLAILFLIPPLEFWRIAQFAFFKLAHRGSQHDEHVQGVIEDGPAVDLGGDQQDSVLGVRDDDDEDVAAQGGDVDEVPLLHHQHRRPHQRHLQKATEELKAKW